MRGLVLLAAAAALAAASSPVALAQETAPPPAAGEAGGAILLEGELRQGGLALGTAPEGTLQLMLDGEAVPLSPEGRFLIGFGRDHPDSATLTARLRNGRSITRRLHVEPRKWRIQHVNVARRPAGPSEAFMRRRMPELQRIEAARSVRSESVGWRQNFILPVKGRISGVFGSQRVYRGEPGSYHTGLDIAPGAGTPVAAPAGGVVVLAGPPSFSLEGKLVIIDHGMGLNSAFLHLANSVVRKGDVVRQGDLIGHVGATGRATGPHLHWSMKWRDQRIDPLALVRQAAR